MILEQIAADTRLRLIEEKKLVSPEEMKKLSPLQQMRLFHLKKC